MGELCFCLFIFYLYLLAKKSSENVKYEMSG